MINVKDNKAVIKPTVNIITISFKGAVNITLVFINTIQAGIDANIAIIISKIVISFISMCFIPIYKFYRG